MEESGSTTHGLPNEGDPPAVTPATDNGMPTRSVVARVTDDSSETVGAPPKNLRTKRASTAVDGAAMLEKVPAGQRMALKQVLTEASKARDEAECAKEELTKVNERLRRAEQDLLEKSTALAKQSEEAEANTAGLRDDLAAAAVTNRDFEFRLRARAIYLWLALAAALSALAVCGFLFTRPLPRTTPHAPLAPRPQTTANRTSAEAGHPRRVEWNNLPTPVTGWQPGRELFERALGDLDRALADIPLTEVESALNEANEWLRASGSPPCTVGFADGRFSLLVTSGSKGSGTLTMSVIRCAQAVEHVADRIRELPSGPAGGCCSPGDSAGKSGQR